MPSGQIQFHWHSQLRSQQVFKAYHVSFFSHLWGIDVKTCLMQCVKPMHFNK